MTNHLNINPVNLDNLNRDLSNQFSKNLDTAIRIYATEQLIDIAELLEGEQNALSAISAPKGRESYLRGRAALKIGLRQLGLNDDTSLLELPHRQISLSHSGSYAIAVTGDSTSLGIGIDLEINRQVKLAMGKFFMTQDERNWLQTLPTEKQLQEILRLWTVKEALFKSDPDNRDRVLRHYTVITPNKWTGLARTIDNPDSQFVYSSLEFKDGFLSVAIRKM